MPLAARHVALLVVFILGVVVGNLLNPEKKYVVFANLLEFRGATSSPTPAAESVENPQPMKVVMDGEFLKRQGDVGSLELPATLKCNPLEHVLVINLEGKRGERRREHIKREFSQANLTQYHFWSAVDASTDQRLAKETGKVQCPCDARLSNSLSHREIYEMILYERWPCATIFEDDVRLAPNFTLRVSETAGSLPPFDVILWGYCPRGGKPRNFEKETGRWPLTLSYGHPGSCLHAYTISLQGAFTFSQGASPVRVPADGVLDGMKHWDPWVRPHIQKAKGKVTGSYWYSTPMVAVQAADADALEGGS